MKGKPHYLFTLLGTTGNIIGSWQYHRQHRRERNGLEKKITVKFWRAFSITLFF